MKKELLLSLSFAVASLTVSFNCAANDWQDISNATPPPPPEELSAAAAAAAPGAIPAEQASTAAPASAPAPAAAATPAPAPAEVLPAPVSAPPEELNTLAPATAPAPARAPKSSAFVLHAAILRTRPTAAGTGDPIAADTRVRMESSVTNSDGHWWFVTATGIGGGWLLESELGDPQQQ